MNQEELDTVWRDSLTPEKLKAIRQKLGMSQGTLGKILGTSATNVSRWEHLSQLPQKRFLDFLKVFDAFTKENFLQKGDVQRSITSDGLPFTLYRLLAIMFEAEGETKQDE